MKDSLARKFVTKRRLRPFHLALCVLFVGWVPSLLLAYYSYTVLRGALEAKSLDDAETLIDSLSQHVSHEATRFNDALDYYRLQPSTPDLFNPPPPPPPPPPPTRRLFPPRQLPRRRSRPPSGSTVFFTPVPTSWTGCSLPTPTGSRWP